MIEGWSLNDARFIALVDAAGGAYEPGTEKLWMEAFSRVIELITVGMRKLPAPEEREVSRGTNLDNRKTDFGRRYNELHKPGNIVVDPAFLSTALGVPFAKDSLIVITLPAGHPGRNFSGLSFGIGLKLNKMRFSYTHARYSSAANSSFFGLQIDLR